MLSWLQVLLWHYLRFEYSANGVDPSPEKSKTISTWPVPKTTKDLRSFLGLANFYHPFVPNFAHTAGPFTALTHKHPQFKTTHLQAFDTLKYSLDSPPILDYPKQHDAFVPPDSPSWLSICMSVLYHKVKTPAMPSEKLHQSWLWDLL